METRRGEQDIDTFENQDINIREPRLIRTAPN
jgi:hypothetical protein